MIKLLNDISCIQFVLTTDDNAIKHFALCSGEKLRREAVVCLSRHAGHRVFDTVSPRLDYIEAKSKTEYSTNNLAEVSGSNVLRGDNYRPDVSCAEASEWRCGSQYRQRGILLLNFGATSSVVYSISEFKN